MPDTLRQPELTDALTPYPAMPDELTESTPDLVPSGSDTVDPDQVETTIQAKQIGERIRRLRTRRSMGLVELGTRTGLSASFLSQLETGRVVPTVRNLARIAMTFGKDLSYFFREDQPAPFRIMRSSERIRLHRASDATPAFISESMHSLVPDGQMVPCLAEFNSSDRDEVFRPKMFDGIEFTFVLQGPVVLNTENESTTLNTGDVAWLDGTRKRNYCTPAGVHARAMIITRHNKG